MAQLVARLDGAFTVEQGPHLGDHRSALGMGGVDRTYRRYERVLRGARKIVAHEDTSSGSSRRGPRMKPRSRATSASSSRSCLRPRCNRDITVPMGVSMISAISLYGNPSTSA